ncbi:hypothetical protein ELQ93_06660 [Labedella gwakjiensis]|uniref:Uncharacterized protein n=1 Tax=Labedella gwakjiensis TaxID=390269 RepID=A0ABY0CA23_9MICO|nr:hypothetical protein ELQ93_06660 [Labedella gwakjiensis]
MTTPDVPPPRIEDVQALLRDTFWRLDPVGVAFDAEFTWNEYHEIADAAARRAADGEDLEAIEREIVREFRQDWGLDHPEETARAAGAAVELYRRRPAVIAAAATDRDSVPLGLGHLGELGSWTVRARPDRVERFEVRRLTPTDPRGSVEQLEVFPLDRHHRPVVVTVVNGGIITVVTSETSYRELEIDHDLVDVIDDITSELLRAFPLITAPRVDLGRLGQRIRDELGGLYLLHVDIPDALLPAFTMDVMAYGRRLGLLPAATAVSGSLWRYENGISLTPVEERIAFALSEEALDVERWLDEWDIAPALRGNCERFWIAVTFHALLLAWESPSFDTYFAGSMDRAWGDSTAFTETIHRSDRLFRLRRHAWLRQHLEADLSAEIAALAAEHIPPGGRGSALLA